MALVCLSLSRLWTGISCKYDWWSAICLFKPSAVHERSSNVTATVDIFPSVAKPPCPAQAQCSTKWIGLKWRSQESNRKPLTTLDFWVSLSNQVSAPDMCSLVASKAVGASKLEKPMKMISDNTHQKLQQPTDGHLGTELSSNHQLRFYRFHP